MAEEKPPEQIEGKTEVAQQPSSKNRLFIMAGIGGVLLLALLIGGFIVFKTISAKKQAESAASAADAAAADPQGANNAEAGHDGKKEDDHKAEPDKKEDGKKEPEKKDDHKAEGDKKDEHKKEGDKSAVKGTSNFGEIYQISRMDLNLGNPVENRYLRMSVGIEYRGGEEQMGELKQREAQIKDIIITTSTSRTRSQLLTENGKELLRREILNRINEVCDKPIQNIFFTEFLVE